MQPDTIIPDPSNPQSLNRYAYTLNNPIRYNDPTGHDPFSDFVGGFIVEIVRTNMWFSPYHQEVGAIQENESDATLAGRLVADVASAVIAAAEVSTGVGGVTGGGGLCVTGVGCLAGAPAIAASGVLITQGAGTGLRAAEGAGTILSLFAKRSKRNIKVDDWTDYPDDIVKRPKDPLTLLEGDEYKKARNAANNANKRIRQNEQLPNDVQVHEINPVKFGGSPTDPANKAYLPRASHIRVTNWWNNFLRRILK